MKQLFALLIVAMIPFMVQSQSVWQRTNSHIASQAQAQSRGLLSGSGLASPANAWWGSGIVYEFGDSDVLNDQFLLSGSVLMEITEVGGVHLPVITNIDLSFDNPIEEFTIGLYPWHRGNGNLVTHGAIQFASDGQLENKRFTLYAGAEYAVISNSGLPLTVSVAPVVDFLKEETVFGLDGVIVVPLANGLGFLANVQKRFSNAPVIYGVGIVTNKIL